MSGPSDPPDTDSFEHHLRVLAERFDLSYQETLEGTSGRQRVVACR
jgi:hypothetical protein